MLPILEKSSVLALAVISLSLIFDASCQLGASLISTLLNLAKSLVFAGLKSPAHYGVLTFLQKKRPNAPKNSKKVQKKHSTQHRDFTNKPLF